jgi:hypothetical protein
MKKFQRRIISFMLSEHMIDGPEQKKKRVSLSNTLYYRKPDYLLFGLALVAPAAFFAAFGAAFLAVAFVAIFSDVFSPSNGSGTISLKRC